MRIALSKTNNGDEDIWNDGTGMNTDVAECTHDAEILFLLSVGSEVNDGSAIIIVGMTVSDTFTDGTGPEFRMQLLT